MGLKQHDLFLSFVLRDIFCYFLCFLLIGAVRVGTHKINGARDIQKRMLLFELIKQKNIDVCTRNL